MEGSTVVIKVKHGDVLRRFNALVVDGKLFLNMHGLREKIVSLFSFAPDTDLMLTYVDEDGDLVALVDDDDLRDVVKQGLNPLRLTVRVNDKSGNQNHSNASSTPLRSPHAQRLPNLTDGVSEILKKVPEPLRETLLKLSEDLAAKASLSSPSIAELVDSLSKVSSSLLGQQVSENGVPNSCSATTNKASEPVKATPKFRRVKPAANMEKKEVKAQNVTGKKEKGASSFDFNAVAKALESENAKPESFGIPHTSHGKEKVKKTAECSNGKSHVGKVAEFPAASSNNLSQEAMRGFASNTLAQEYIRRTRHLNGHPNWGTLQNFSAASPHWASNEVPFTISSQNDGSGVIHLGVRCDGCSVHPIVGPRFKSKVKEDYDLCGACHDKIENSGEGNDYMRIDHPAVPRRQLPQFLAMQHGPMFPHFYGGSKGKPGAVKLDSRFIQDVNILDDTVMAPLTPFTKIWRMRNNGTVAWPHKTQLVWIGGDKLTDTLSVEVQIPAAGLLVDQELDVAVDFVSPKLPGRYISYWRMAAPSGPKFGQRVWVLIQVAASNNGTPHDIVKNLNLNLPPAGSSAAGPEIINVDPEREAEAEAGPSKVGNSKKVVESSKLPTAENELKFPINDSLLVGNGAGSSSSSAAPSSSSSIPYPVVDLTGVVQTFSSAPHMPFSPYAIPSAFSMPPPSPFMFRPPFSMPPLPPGAIPPPPPPHGVVPHPPPQHGIIPPPPHLLSAATIRPSTLPPPLPPLPPAEAVLTAPEPFAELPAKDQVEDKLLKELEEMGFKQVDLNKEVLRMNEYDLEQAVDDLCGVAEWDPILEELAEMGFHNTEMNKMLLKKNNGSIKRVVMDLIAGEEEA